MKKNTYHKNLTGLRFGKLIVVYFSHVSKSPDGRNRFFWRCVCDCGQEHTAANNTLVSGHAKSCGCLYQQTRNSNSRHGHCKAHQPTPTYRSWAAMKARCLNPNLPDYADYGGRGITVCKRWRESFAAFLKDMGERPPDRTLDRKNTNGNYTKANCRWATPKEQVGNRRNTKHATTT